MTDPPHQTLSANKLLSLQMAAESSQRAASPSTLRRTFDVFLSFRGETRLGFTDHLHFALQSKGLLVFKDEEKLERGENIRPELLKAIQESEYAVIIISENYASSTWCLDELIEIVKCKKEKELKVLPIFYQVDPSNIRKQKASFGVAFAKHAINNVDEERRKMWRDALEEVCSISGWDVRNRHESKVVEEICRKITDGLSRQMLKIDDDIVGIESQIEELMTLLCIRGDDVRFIGICGMGGIGKTTLAEVIYSKVFSRFEADCFILNIREEFQKFGNMLLLQKELISQIFGEKELKIRNTFQGRSLIANKAKNKRVFIVLDDVDKEVQLEELVGNHNWFGKGSKILVTSRDGHLLERHMDEIYEVKELTGHHALQLFNLKAFKQCYYEGNYEQYSKEIVKYAGGLPLALKIFGSFLFDCKTDAWESALDRLKVDPGSNLLDILKVSFEGLDRIQQSLFLDIACFFKGELVIDVIYKLEALGRFPKNDIPILEKKSLIKISKKNTFQMHDLLQQMGHQIVNELQKEPGKRSRLWYYKDIIHVLNNNTGTNAIESIVLKLPLSQQVTLDFEALSKMRKLKMLVIQPIHEVRRDDQIVVEWRGNPSKLTLSNELCILEWWGFPLNYVSNICDLDNLVSLKMPKNFIKQPWTRQKRVILRRLRRSIVFEDVDRSSQTSIGHLDPQSNLQRSIRHQDHLDLQKCSVLSGRGSNSNPSSFSYLNSILCLMSLVELDLSSSKLVDEVLPDDLSCLSSLKHLYLRENEFEKLPDSISQLSSLCTLDLRGCTLLQTLPPGICQLSKLEGLYLDFCLQLKSLPPKLPFYLANLSVENCPLSGKFSDPLAAVTSSVQLLIGDSSIMGFYFGYEDKPYASIYLTESANGWFEQPSMRVSWGPTLKSEIPEWFNQRISSFFGINEACRFNQTSTKLSRENQARWLNSFFTMDKVGMTLDMHAALSQALPFQMDEAPQSNQTSTKLSRENQARWLNSFFTTDKVGMTLDVHAALSQALPLQMDENRSAMLMHWGLALFIEYEIHEPDNCERESEKQKADERGSSTSGIFDRNCSATPAFLCKVEDNVDGSRSFIGFGVPDVLPFGRHGVWACIRHPSFMSLFRNGIAVEGEKYFKPIRREIEVSIKTISLNVEVKECGARVVHIPAFGGSGIRPPHDLCEVLSNISPHGLLLLDPETIWVGGKRQGPRLRL